MPQSGPVFDTDFANDFAGPYPEQEDAEWPIKKPRKYVHGEDGAVTTFVAFVKPRSIVLGIGALVMFLLLVTPSWNAIGLLQDPVYTYFNGSSAAGWLLACCILLFVFSYITLQVLLDRMQPSKQTEQTLLFVSGVFLSVMGLMFVLFAGVIEPQVDAAKAQVVNDCRMGASSQRLFIASKELHSLRATPACMKLGSIEECMGYSVFSKKLDRTTEVQVLKAMETDYLCAGYCAGKNQTGAQIYPPTLFSQADYQVSCDGMAVRRLRNFGGEVGSQMAFEGMALLIGAAVIGLSQLILLCASRPQETMSSKSYGATL